MLQPPLPASFGIVAEQDEDRQRCWLAASQKERKALEKRWIAEKLKERLGK